MLQSCNRLLQDVTSNKRPYSTVLVLYKNNNNRLICYLFLPFKLTKLPCYIMLQGKLFE